MYDEMVKRKYISQEDCLRHFEMVKELWETGDIRQTTWDSFCMCCLDELMKENKKVLHRLKN